MKHGLLGGECGSMVISSRMMRIQALQLERLVVAGDRYEFSDLR